jgi:hypothetical protein
MENLPPLYEPYIYCVKELLNRCVWETAIASPRCTGPTPLQRTPSSALLFPARIISLHLVYLVLFEISSLKQAIFASPGN